MTPAERLLFMIYYEGPWERLANRFGTFDSFAAWCDERDRAWVDRHARATRKPSAYWRRRAR